MSAVDIGLIFLSNYVLLIEFSGVLSTTSIMSGSGKGLIGLWLYKMGDSTDWTLKEAMQRKAQQVSTWFFILIEIR